MRIAFLTHFPGRGGSTVLLQQLAAFFTSRGHSVDIVCGSDDPTPLISAYSVVPARSRGDWRQRRCDYLACVGQTKPDVVYAISGGEEFDLLRFIEVPRAHHIFSLEQHEWMDIPRLIRLSAKHTELFSANTDDVLEAVRAIAVPAEPSLAVAPYRISHQWFDYSEPTRPITDVLRVCFTARLENFQKRADWLGKIIPECHRRNLPLEWHLIGDGPALSQIRREISASNAAVHFHGWLTPAAIQDVYQRSDLFFLCSRWEGLPIAMVEAMASGLACVVPRIPGGILHLMKGDDAGWVYDATSPLAAVEALVAACASRSELEVRKKQAARISRRQFSAAAAEKQLLALETQLQQLAFNGNSLHPENTPPLRRVSLGRYLARLVRQGRAAFCLPPR